RQPARIGIPVAVEAEDGRPHRVSPSVAARVLLYRPVLSMCRTRAYHRPPRRRIPAVPDLLVRLYDLPDPPSSAAIAAEGIALRRAIPPERHVVTGWIARTFGARPWVSECETAMSSLPVRTW